MLFSSTLSNGVSAEIPLRVRTVRMFASENGKSKLPFKNSEIVISSRVSGYFQNPHVLGLVRYNQSSHLSFDALFFQHGLVLVRHEQATTVVVGIYALRVNLYRNNGKDFSNLTVGNKRPHIWSERPYVSANYSLFRLVVLVNTRETVDNDRNR